MSINFFSTLSGIIRVSPRGSVSSLRQRFVQAVRTSTLPDRGSPTYHSLVRHRHAAVLGICAIIDSYPYTVERWMPQLITDVLAEHTYDPVRTSLLPRVRFVNMNVLQIPIASTARKCGSNFRKTHQDTWHEDSKQFTDTQLSALATLITGSSYCMSIF